jgi:ubiquinone/menaquinone biosynthesis C-methylase UbiE
MNKSKLEITDFLEIERAFHDSYAERLDWDKPLEDQFSYDSKNRGFVEVEKTFKRMLGSVKGKRILDIGSGFGNAALNLAKEGAVVSSIDISKNLIDGCKYRAQKYDIEVDFQVMDAQDLGFGDNEFDIILGYRTIHHLQDLNTFLEEANRCLKPGGYALFVEPQKHNPFIEFGRKFIKNSYETDRTPTEHPLVPGDIRLMKEIFGNLEKREYIFLSAGCMVFQMLGCNRLFKIVDTIFNSVDCLLSSVPFLRPLYWQVIIKCYKKEQVK